MGGRRLAAPLLASALLMAGGCGHSTPAAKAPACKALPPGEGPDAAGTLQDAQNGGTWCLRSGQVLTVYLHAATPDQAARWAPVDNDAPKVLRPGNNGTQTLVIGVTGAIFDAIGKGTATLTSKRPDGASWRATVVVSG